MYTFKKIITSLAILLIIPVIGQAQKSISLAGNWQFKADSLTIGEKEHWELKPLAQTIYLPGSTDQIKLGNFQPLFKSALGQTPPADYPENADYGMLTRTHKYIGVAWYRKDFVVTKTNGKVFFIDLERVMWRSKLWVDGKPAGGPIDFLSSPHHHFLGRLLPGRHTVTIMIDNRQVYPIGTLAHSYCPHMQTEWNGIVGNIRLTEKPLLGLSTVKVFPSFVNKEIRISFEVDNQLPDVQPAMARFIVKEKKNGKIIADESTAVDIATGMSAQQKTIQLKNTPLPWSEFTPDLYELTTVVTYKDQSDKINTSFGFRDIGVAGKHFTINGKKLLYRNSHEGMFFGKTGYPAMDTVYWMKLFKVYKSHGFNAVRFHSACPPDAAFAAADALGIYLQVEFFWMDGWMGYKDLIGGSNDTLNQFVRNELHEALTVYGNHPSMMLVAIGNELGGDFDTMGKWIAAEKKEDDRHFYAAGIAHNITTADDFVEYGGKGDAIIKPGTDWDYTDNYMVPSKHNYDKAFRRKDLPEFTHELGQYIVHPLWSEIAKYTGPVQPLNMLYFKSKAYQNGIGNRDAQFQKASGNLNRILFKAEVEATLRTPESAGYGLLSMVDYPGQGEAYIGWVDPFYQNKNFITPQQFKMYGNHTVPLIRIKKMVWEEGDTLQAAVEVVNYGAAGISNAVLKFILKDGDKIIVQKKLAAKDIPQGGITSIGNITQLLGAGDHGKQLTILVSIEGTGYANSWDIWVFPKNKLTPPPKNVLITASITAALTALKKGDKVILLASKLGPLKDKTYAAFAPVFWSATWFEGQETEVIGAVIQDHHGAMKAFPTKTVTDWQWLDVCKDGRGFILNDLPKNYIPIVEPVDDYHFGNKLGSIFELKTTTGGRLLVCGYNITDELTTRIAARQLRNSLLAYAASGNFNPQQLVTDEWLSRTFIDLDLPLKKAPGFENAFLYVAAAARQPNAAGAVEWSPEVDGALKENGIDYTIHCEGAWREEGGTYWFGKKMTIEITVPFPRLMELKIRFQDPNHAGRTGEISCEDNALIKLGSHVDGEWITIPITRENCLDGKIIITTNCTSGPNLMISHLVLSPK